MTIEEFLKKQNQERIKREERAIRRLLAVYGRLDRALAGAYEEEEKGRGGEEENHPGAEAPPLARHEGSSEGLVKRKRLKSLLDTVKAEIGKFGEKAAAIIGRAQREEIGGQREAAGELLKLLGVKAPKIPPGGLENGPGMMGDGSKLADYFSKKLAETVAERVKQAASNSAAAKPGDVLKKLKAAHGILLGRTLTAGRTETMRAGRETAHGIYMENGITEWTWHSQLGPTTCAFCRSQHGTRHLITEKLVSHPNCRCIQLPDDGAVAERLEAERIDRLYAEIERRGHAVQRHGEAITEQQLDDRAVDGKDPASGTIYDAYNKNPDGTPALHKYGKDATKFRTKADLVRAEEFLRLLPEFADKLEYAENNAGSEIRIDNVKLEDIFGADYRDHVFGKTRTGTKNNPLGSRETDFTDGTLFGYFQKDASGKWHLFTMYPKPKN